MDVIVTQYGSHKRTNTVAFHYRYNYEVTKVEHEIARSWGGTKTEHSVAQSVIPVLRRVRQDGKFKASLQDETNKETNKTLNYHKVSVLGCIVNKHTHIHTFISHKIFSEHYR